MAFLVRMWYIRGKNNVAYFSGILPWLGIPLYNKPRFGLSFLGIFEKRYGGKVGLVVAYLGLIWAYFVVFGRLGIFT